MRDVFNRRDSRFGSTSPPSLTRTAKSALMILPVLISIILLGPVPARASSDDAWAAFARDVAKACKAATGSTFIKPDVIVDPFGSEKHGLAIVTGKLKAGGTTATILCAYDKTSKKAEIGSELGEDVVKVSRGKRS